MLKFSKQMMLIMFLATAVLVSCEKKNEIPVEETAGATDLKFQKMERFISIMWQVPSNEILFDKSKNEFSFGEVKMSKDEIEKIYDISNEYKLKYENN